MKVINLKSASIVASLAVSALLGGMLSPLAAKADITLPSTTQSAYAFINDDGTINTAYSKNILATKVIEVAVGNDDYCFKLPFNPKVEQNNAALGIYLGVSGAPGGNTIVTSECGAGYNALMPGVQTGIGIVITISFYN